MRNKRGSEEAYAQEYNANIDKPVETKQKAQMTPGPWRLREWKAVMDTRLIVETDQGTVCRIQRLENYDDANARAIAALPELIKALRRLKLFTENDQEFIEALGDESASLGENAGTWLWRQRLIDDAEAALRKAGVL